MEGIGGILALVFIAALGYAGFTQAPLWLPLVAAFPGIVLYFMVRPGAINLIQRDGVSFLITTYIAQVVTCGIIFFIGYGIGAAVK